MDKVQVAGRWVGDLEGANVARVRVGRACSVHHGRAGNHGLKEKQNLD